MRRRECVALLGGAAAYPIAARGQQVRRSGVLMNLGGDDPEGQARNRAFLQALQEFGWHEGRNVRIDTRWGGGDTSQIQRHATDLVALAPEIILASTNQVTVSLHEVTRTTPIVFVAVTDPVASGLVESLSRPRGNATGFTSAEYGMSAQWLELLKEIAPAVTRAAVLHNPGNPGSIPQFAAIQAIAPTMRVELSTVSLRDAGEIDGLVMAFARTPNGGLIITRIAESLVNRDLIIRIAANQGLPAVYP